MGTIPPAVCQCPMLRHGILTAGGLGALIADDGVIYIYAQHHCDSLCKAGWAAEALHGHEVCFLQRGLE